jgi:hypothetical protein
LSDNSQTTALAISSGSAKRHIGCIDLRVSTNCLLSSATRLSGSVSTVPGAIAFILIPDLAYSSYVYYKQSRSKFLSPYIHGGYYLDMGTVDDPAAYEMKKEIRREQESQKEDIHRQSFIHKYIKQLEQEMRQEIEDADGGHDKSG